MQLHQLKPSHKKKPRKRVGRGGKRGTYAGRGVKGQNARAGKKPRATFAGGDTTFAKRLPKQRGSVGPVKIKRGSKRSGRRVKPLVIDVKKVLKQFKSGEIVSPKTIKAKKALNRIKGATKVKVLGKAKGMEKLVFKGVRLSQSIRPKEEKKVIKKTKPKKTAKVKKTEKKPSVKKSAKTKK